ncbi:uncharacterized protein LOC131878963 [Tigriopus californicus]|uniref:uncharacterized protein LOC131878963 n=1 Tax=Tigriopus californicus TaxID=6832 RepID=UPI0027DA6BA1|nr:uncharacterized protein LOC131878963 [Tigriopus californicus]
MPAHIQCQGELICLMTRLGWLWTVANLHPESQDDKQEMEIHTQKVIETFRKENEAWFGRSDLALEFGHCSHEFGNDKYFFQQIDIAATYFLKCLQEKLRRQLCAGCVSDYWNDFRGYPRTRRRPKWIEIAPIKRSESCFKCV